MRTALIIEDEAFLAFELQMLLEDIGINNVLIALDVNTAVTLASHTKPDLIVSDYNLTDGTGPQAVKRIQERHGHIPTIYITATPEAIEGLPCHSVLSKPLNDKELLELLKTLNN